MSGIKRSTDIGQLSRLQTIGLAGAARFDLPP
jgi:hypothetical protein